MNLDSRALKTRWTLCVVAAALGGCSTVGNWFSGDKVDYRSVSKTPARALEVPPDLTQLSRDSRYQVPGGPVSAAAASTRPAPAAASTTAGAIAPQSVGDLRIERAGNSRWLVASLPPEKLWPQVREFWIERGFTIASELPEAGIMDTDWAENRAKIPQDPIRSVIGKVLDGLYDSGERDRFRTRIERVAGGSEIYISHRGMAEVFTDSLKERTVWQARPADPELEAEFLARLMVRLGAKEETARATIAAAPEAPARARALSTGAALEMDEPFDRAWRRLGLALDRSGFSVEDRDRAAGLYFVRYIDPKDAAREEPGFLSRLFGRGETGPTGPVRYRLAVKGEGQKTTVSVLNSAGMPEDSENTRSIVTRLVTDLK